MAFKLNRVQIAALSQVVRESFSSEKLGENAAALAPEIVRCVANLLTSENDLQQLGNGIYTILMGLPSCTEETPAGPIEHYDLAPLAVRAQRARNLTDLMAQFTPGAANLAVEELLYFYSGPSQPFGIQGEYYRAVLPVRNVEHAMQVLAQLGVTSKPEDIGCIFIEDIARVSVWGNIAEQDGKWTMVLEVHDPHSSYEATFTAFARACIVNQALVKYLLSSM